MSLTMESPLWKTFIERLAGPEGCNFQFRDEGKEAVTWECAGGSDQSKALRILTSLGLAEPDIEATLAYARKHGGHCDCEIVLNLKGGE